MGLGTIYYLVTLSDRIRSFSGWILVILILALVLGSLFLLAATLELEGISEDIPVKKVYKYLVSVICILTLITMTIPPKKELLIILSANYIDHNILQNENVEKKALEYLDLIDKRVVEFLKEGKE